jgi:Do/DeqQ family serine protease
MNTPRFLLPLLALLAAGAGAVGLSRAGGPELPAPVRQVPADAGSMRLSFAPVVKRASPAVVNVYSRQIVRQQVDPFWQMFGGGIPGMTRERVAESLGSGVIIRSDGVIVTNNHVVDNGQSFMVVLSDRREFPAKLLMADPRTDLAVLKIDVGPEKLPTLAIADRVDTQVGDLVLAIGNPFGIGQTVTNGIVSALNRAEDPGGGGAGSYIQTDAPINPGNSGGALVDMNGNLIGINSFILSRSGTSSGVGFAIPAAMVRRVADAALGGGHLVRAWLGARTDPVTGEIARSLGMAAPGGALVTAVYPGSPAARAGVKIGDVITSIDNEAVADPANLNYRIDTLKPGETARLQVLRNGRPEILSARVEAPSGASSDERTLAGESPLTGVTVANLTPATADQLGLDPFAAQTGVVVVKVSPSTYAGQIGLQAGDVIRGVNGREVESVGDLQAALARGAPQRVWSLTLQRGGQVITARFRA